MLPRAEIAHWLFAAGFLFFALVLLAEAIVGPEVFRRRAWRAYLWPSLLLFAGLWLWVVTIFSTFSTLHLLAHSAWAQAATAAGAVQLAVVRGRLVSRYWSLVTAAGLLVSGSAFLIHEQNGWLFARSAFLHHLIGWTMVVAVVFPLGAAFRPRWPVWAYGFAATWIAVAVMLFTDRDVAPIFGHLSEFAGGVPLP
jgi:hypothetical protein